MPMASITLTFPDTVAPRIAAAMEAEGWTPELGITRMEFTRDWLARQLKQVVIKHESEAAADAARITVRDSVEAEIIIT